MQQSAAPKIITLAAKYLLHIFTHVALTNHPSFKEMPTSHGVQLILQPETTLKLLIAHLALPLMVFHQQHVVLDLTVHVINP